MCCWSWPEASVCARLFMSVRLYICVLWYTGVCACVCVSLSSWSGDFCWQILHVVLHPQWSHHICLTNRSVRVHVCVCVCVSVWGLDGMMAYYAISYFLMTAMNEHKNFGELLKYQVCRRCFSENSLGKIETNESILIIQ